MRVCVFIVYNNSFEDGKEKSSLVSCGSSSFDEGGENARILRIKRKREREEEKETKIDLNRVNSN